MENISDSHRVVTDTSDTNDSGRSIIDKGRTFLRRAGESLEKAGQSMKKYRTGEEQEKLRAFEDKAKTVGERIDLAGLGLVTFGPEGIVPFAIDETVGTGLVILGEGAEAEAAIVDRFQNTTHVIGRKIKTAGKTMEHLGKKAKEDGSDIVDNYETAVAFSGGSYDKKEDKRDNVTLQGRTFERDKELSNQNNAFDVWREINCEDPNDCHVYFAYKGTNPKHMKDLYYDWHILMDSTEDTKMFKEYDRLTKEAVDKYGDTHKIHMVGHSKAGNVISKLSCVYHPESAITFNKGAVPWESSCKDRKTHVHNFTTGYDLISAATYFPRKKESTHFITTNKNVSLLDPAYFHNMDHFRK